VGGEELLEKVLCLMASTGGVGGNRRGEGGEKNLEEENTRRGEKSPF